jgi:hypothetical protein
LNFESTVQIGTDPLWKYSRLIVLSFNISGGRADSLGNVRQIHYNESIVSLHVSQVDIKNTGTYVCKLFTTFGVTAAIKLQLRVTGENFERNGTALPCDLMFYLI